VRRFVPFLSAVLAAWPTPARAQEGDSAPEPPLRWDENRPRFRPLEYVATTTVGLAAIAEYVWLPAQREPHWVGGILFDDAARDALRLRSPAALPAAWTAADAVGVTSTVLVVGVDSFVVPLARGSFDVAWQLTWMDLESYAFGSIATFTLYDTIGRARPSYADCLRQPSGPDCRVSPTASFPSGHTAEVFLSAGLSCTNHAHVPIYGSPLMDALACARDVTLATADGVLRIMGDRHYASDVLTGAAIGFSFGYGLPWLLHYVSRNARRSLQVSLTPLVGGETGLAATGTF
jgi:membrane-associated phospholipid phosphatase